MAQGSHFVSGVAVATNAGVGGVALIDASGCGDLDSIAMAGGRDHNGVAVAAGTGVNGLAVGGAGSLGGLLSVAMAGGGDCIGVSVAADGAGVDLAAVLGAGGGGLHAGVLVARGLQNFHILITAGAGGGDRAVSGAGGSHGDSLVLVLMCIFVSFHEDNQPVILLAHLRGGEGLECGAGVADGVVVAGTGAANCQDLAAVLGFQAPVAVGAGGRVDGDGLAGGTGGGTCGAQILAVVGVLQGELAALGGGGPGQGLVIGDDVSAVVIRLDGDFGGTGRAVDGIGAHAGVIVAVVYQQVTLAGFHGSGLAPDGAGNFGLFGDFRNVGDGGLGGSGFGGSRLSCLGLGRCGLGGFGNLGGGNGSMVAGDSHIQGVVAGIDTGTGVGGVLDGVLINQDSHDHIPAGAGRGVGTGGSGLHVAAADVGEVQGHGLGVAAAVRADGHGAALCVVVVGGLVILVVVAEEECHVHLSRNGVDGRTPLVSVAVVVTVVQQGLVGDNQQRTVLVELRSVGAEILDGLLHGCGKAVGCAVAGETGAVAVIGGHVAHAQHVDIVVAVVVGAVDAVITGAVNQMAGLVQQGAAVFQNSVAVMVGPDVVDGHLGIAQGAADVSVDGGSIAGVFAVAGVAVVVNGKCIAAAVDRGNGQAGLLDGTENAGDRAFLVIALVGVQIGEDNCGINGCLGSFGGQDVHGDRRKHQNQNQQCGHNSLHVVCRFHCHFSFTVVAAFSLLTAPG